MNDPDELEYYLFPGVTVNWAGEDWRLPDAGTDPQSGFNVTTSEMGHLYYDELGFRVILTGVSP